MILKWYHSIMKLLTRDTDYAVRAICSMAARPGEVVTAGELVKELRIPRPFLRKILQRLSKKGLIESSKGSGGGFRLSMRISKISIADLVEAFQGPLNMNKCAFKKKTCPNTRVCPLKRRIDQITDRVESELRSITIGSLIGERHK